MQPGKVWGLDFWGFSIDFGHILNICIGHFKDRIHLGGGVELGAPLKDAHGFALFSLRLLKSIISVVISITE